jgi:hypothetical protein
MPKTAFSENISRLLVNNSRKGFVVALKGKDGRHTIMANGGNGTEPNKKRTLAFAIPSPRDQDELRKAIALRIIKSDIEFVMRKNLRLKSNASMAAVLSSVQTNTATPKGAFEKHFKSLIREQGASASPVAAARYLFAAMPYTEKRKLGISLNAMNIKTNQELERLLHKWTAEALKGIAAQAPSRIKKHEPEHER